MRQRRFKRGGRAWSCMVVVTGRLTISYISIQHVDNTHPKLDIETARNRVSHRTRDGGYKYFISLPRIPICQCTGLVPNYMRLTINIIF